eukprot:COSAG06_NODE_561_length_14287_cov_13.422047_6_plen_270_part_00
MTETLKELVVHTGTGEGQTVKFLFAADYSWTADHRFEVRAYVRNGVTGRWNATVVASGPVSRVQQSGGSLSLRAACVHRDRVTHEERVFILVGTLGIFSGVVDGSLDGMVRWDAEPEPLPSESHETRPLAVIEADGNLLMSSGRYIFRRNDGPKPTYKLIHTVPGGRPTSGLGGIRGLTAIPAQNGGGDSTGTGKGGGGGGGGGGSESLLFLYCGHPAASAHGSGACMHRLDPDGNGGYTVHRAWRNGPPPITLAHAAACLRDSLCILI